MSSLIYLVSKSVKNTVLEILHKPAKLILWVVTIGGIVGLFFLSVFTRQQTGQEGGFADLIWLKGGFFAFITIFVVLSVQKGLSSGDTIFDMSDVNLLFVSPVSPRSILLYGIVRMARTSFLMGFFILFQSNSLGTAFGLDFGGLMLLFVGFLLAMCLLQILSLLIYSLTNGNPARKRVVQGITVAVFLPVAVTIAMNLTKTGEILSALEATLRTPVADWTPVMGWASAMVGSAATTLPTASEMVTVTAWETGSLMRITEVVLRS